HSAVGADGQNEGGIVGRVAEGVGDRVVPLDHPDGVDDVRVACVDGDGRAVDLAAVRVGDGGVDRRNRRPPGGAAVVAAGDHHLDLGRALRIDRPGRVDAAAARGSRVLVDADGRVAALEVTGRAGDGRGGAGEGRG